MFKYRDLSEKIKSNPEKYLQCKFISLEDTTNPLEYAYSFGHGLGGRMIGSSIIDIDLNLFDVVWRGFYPMEFVSGARKKGIGTLTHILTLETLANKAKLDFGVSLSQFHVGHLDDVSRKRIRQLNKMGIEWRRMTPFPEYLEKSREYARQIGVL